MTTPDVPRKNASRRRKVSSSLRGISRAADMAQPGTEADRERSCGELAERGKQVWRTDSGVSMAAEKPDRRNEF